jgi:hypothetical protein
LALGDTQDTTRIKADTPPRTVLNEKIAKEFWDSKPISPPPEPPDAAEIITARLLRELISARIYL